MTNLPVLPAIFKTLVAIAAGLSLALTAGVVVHVISGSNDTVATLAAGAALIAGGYSIRADI